MTSSSRRRGPLVRLLGVALAAAVIPAAASAETIVWSCRKPADLPPSEALHADGSYIVAFDEARGFGCHTLNRSAVTGRHGAVSPTVVARLNESLAENCDSDMNGLKGLPLPPEQRFQAGADTIGFGDYVRLTLDRRAMTLKVEMRGSDGVYSQRWRGDCAVSTDFDDPVPRRRTPRWDTGIDWKALTAG